MLTPLSMLQSNTVIAPSPTLLFLQDFLPAKCGIRTTFVPVADVAAVAAAITPRWVPTLPLHSTRLAQRRPPCQPGCSRARPSRQGSLLNPPAHPPCSTKLIYTESLSNPTLVLADIPALSQLARSKVTICSCRCCCVHRRLRHRCLRCCFFGATDGCPHRCTAGTGAHWQGLKLVVDNTFTPCILSPLR